MAFIFTPQERQIMASNGISYKIAYHRYKKANWSKHDAITKPLGSRGNKTLWEQYELMANENKIKKHTFYKRVSKGMDPNLAATLKVDPALSHPRRNTTA